MTRGTLVAGAFLTLAVLAGCAPSSPVSDSRVGKLIRAELAQKHIQQGPPGIDRIGTVLPRVYRGRHHAPLWSHRGTISGNAKELLDVLQNDAPKEGLNPDTYGAPRIERLLEGRDDQPDEPARLAELDVLLSRGFLMYASHLASGQVAPRKVDANWYTRPDRADLQELLSKALQQGTVRTTLASLAPHQPGYVKLKQAYQTYRALATRGGWPAVPAGPPLRLGAKGTRVAALTRRLAAEGDLAPGDTASVFSARVRDGVRRFELRHGQTVDGVVDAEDIAKMNIPVATRLRTLEMNLERWRWLPPASESRYLQVNIPAYMLVAYENERPVLRMRVVVGKQYTPTPVFTGNMSYLVLNPTWNVPLSIVRKEMLQQIAQDPGYLEREHMRVITASGDEAPQDAAADTEALASGRYRIRQDPGEDNALGQLKFMFPNQFNVYLHDTPTRFFGREDRAISHGCIRVEQPMVLAEYVLRGGDWDSSRVEAALRESKEEQVVSLPHRIPVHLLYWTAWVDEDGRTQFRDDVYGLDTRLDRALRMHVTLRADAGQIASPARSPRRTVSSHADLALSFDVPRRNHRGRSSRT